jgi:PAS domain S-box-containing protein
MSSADDARLVRAADLVHELSTSLGPVADASALCERILDAAIAIMGADFGSLQALQGEGPHAGELKLVAQRGFSRAAARFWEWVRPDSSSSCAGALRSGERTVVPDVETCGFMAGTDDLAAFREAGIRSCQTTPLRSRADGAVVGMLSTHWLRPHAAADRELKLFDLLARQTADLIDRQRVEDAHQATAARLRTVIENSRDAINMLDLASGRYVLMSPAQVGLTGFTEEELREMTAEAVYDRVHPDDRHVAVSQQKTLAAGLEPESTVEYRWKVKSGEYRWFSDSRKLVRDGQGRPVALVGVSRDITKRKRLEERLRRSEARQALLLKLSDAIRSLDDPVAIQGVAARLIGEHLDVNLAHYAETIGEHVKVDQGWARGMPPLIGEFRLMDFGERLVATCRSGRTAVCHDAEADPTITAAEREVLAAVRVRGYVAVPLVKGGEWVSTLAVHTMAPRRWQPHEIELVEDVAERTWAAVERARAERALAASEAKYRSLFDSIDEGFCIIEVLFEGDRPIDYRFLEANPAFEQHTGLAGAVGRRMRELAPGHEEHWFRIYGEVARTGEPARFEAPADALGRHYDVFAFRVGAPEERRVALLFNDVTARQRAEEELRAANARLAEADRRKSEFLAVLSHELRNPLAPIQNSIYLLERAPPGSEPAARAREILHRQADHLARLVDDLLDVTRISRGKVELRRTRLDLRDVVRRTTDDLRSVFDATGIELRLEQSAGPVWVEGDVTRLAQVLGNLLQNSVKFTPAAGTVSVALSEGDGVVTLSVRDTGAGIPQYELQRMFEPFAQGAQDTARTKGGLGLGLSLVKGLVELHGGSVRASSAGAGSGSEFVVTLPLAEPPPAATQVDRQGGPSRLVLIVEDNPDAGRTLGDVLELSGHRVRVVTDARSGVALAREVRPDVILCDIGMPEMDGYDFARAIRSDPVLRRTRLIAVTGYAQPEDDERARQAGFDAHLPKPPPLDVLERLLREEPAIRP